MSNDVLIKALSLIARTDGGSVELNAKACYLLAKTALEEYAAQQGAHWTAYAVLGLGVFALGMIFGFWLAGI